MIMAEAKPERDHDHRQRDGCGDWDQRTCTHTAPSGCHERLSPSGCPRPTLSAAGQQGTAVGLLAVRSKRSLSRPWRLILGHDLLASGPQEGAYDDLSSRSRSALDHELTVRTATVLSQLIIPSSHEYAGLGLCRSELASVGNVTDYGAYVAALQPAEPAQAGNERDSGGHQYSGDGVDADL
jgi:hypothetical protein